MKIEMDHAVLAVIFEHGGAMDFDSVRRTVECTKRDLFRVLHRQYDLGNIRRHNIGEPVTLTSSARVAIAAGRYFPPMLEADMSNIRQSSLHLSEGAIRATVNQRRANSCEQIKNRSDSSIAFSDRMTDCTIKNGSKALISAIARHHPNRITPIRMKDTH